MFTVNRVFIKQTSNFALSDIWDVRSGDWTSESYTSDWKSDSKTFESDVWNVRFREKGKKNGYLRKTTWWSTDLPKCLSTTRSSFQLVPTQPIKRRGQVFFRRGATFGGWGWVVEYEPLSPVMRASPSTCTVLTIDWHVRGLCRCLWHARGLCLCPRVIIPRGFPSLNTGGGV